MEAVVRDSVSDFTNTNQIVVSWTKFTTDEETGGSPITKYEIDWDKGTVGVTWEQIATPLQSEDNFHIQTTDVDSGVNYMFRIRAVNIHGAGLFSQTTTI